MKKILLFAACAGLVFASCSKDVVSGDIQDPNDEQTPVAFGVYSNTTATRAETLGADNIKALGVGLFAFEQGQADLDKYSKANFQPNFMFNQKLEWDPVNTKWTYSPIKYWPNNPGAKVSFYAYAPYNANFSSDTYIQTPETNTYLGEVVPDANGMRMILGYDMFGPGIEYNLPADPTKGTDLMWGAIDASPAPNPLTSPVNLTKPGINDQVKFKMKHALSRLAFTIQVITDDTDGSSNLPLAANTTIKVKRVSLIGNFANKGVLRLYDGNWSVANGNNQTLEFVEGASQFSATVEAGLTGSDALAAIPLLKQTAGLTDNYIMAIPGAKFYIEIEYDVITTDANDSKNNSTVTNVISSLAAGGGTVSPTTGLEDGKFKLEAGTAYLFNLKIGMTSVKFDVDLSDDWNSPATTYNVDLPKNN